MNRSRLDRPFCCLLTSCLFGFLVILVGVLWHFGIGPAVAFLIGQSHISANVPSEKEFDAILSRDLQAYFQDLTGRPVAVDYEFLRQGPTQVGVAYPKYYLWVQVVDGTLLVDEGAVRIAAVDKTHIDVTRYVSREQIVANPGQLDTIFPGPACVRILERMDQ